MIGIRESARFHNIIVVVKVAIVLLVIGFGIRFVNTANWTPVFPPNLGEVGQFGWSGVLRGAGVIFFAYIGFDAVSTAAQEAKNPQKDLPVGILGSLAVCTVLYIARALVMTDMANYTELNVPHPVFVAIQKAGPSLAWLGYLVNIGAIAGLASVVLVRVSRASSIRWRAMACCHPSSARCIQDSRRRTCRRSLRAPWRRSLPASSHRIAR